ncbi:GrpB family protein [Streptomyces sp. NBC_01304]|uniref:GrpB family protein n=1 Tax=Streptomyces sp. NBC_01304 TaxID=2903818 RepID=UPI002E0FADC7|nr:GrpB family protein [Streptomyces sp. NBC_01304]
MTESVHPVVVPYTPAWHTRGLELAADLHTALAPHAAYVDHIGSTSIPGMAAKPLYDLQVSVPDLAQAAAAFEEPLAERGFVRSPYQEDHVPAWSDDDQSLWLKRLWTRRGHSGGLGEDINLHVRPLDAPNERLALLFRDWFRAHPEAIDAYARFKGVLAAALDDTGTYADIKDPVVDLIITVAEPWATQTDWKPHA